MAVRSALFAVVLMITAFAQADGYGEAWGPSLGTSVVITAADHNGQPRTLGDLSGEKGLVLFLNRSADW
jgi:hypothetical protein